MPNILISIFVCDTQTIFAGGKNDLQGRGMAFATHVPLQILIKRGVCTMAKNTVPEAKEALNRFKMEAAAEVGVNLKNGYNGDLTSKQAGSVGGQMVKKMIKAYEESMK